MIDVNNGSHFYDPVFFRIGLSKQYLFRKQEKPRRYEVIAQVEPIVSVKPIKPQSKLSEVEKW